MFIYHWRDKTALEALGARGRKRKSISITSKATRSSRGAARQGKQWQKARVSEASDHRKNFYYQSKRYSISNAPQALCLLSHADTCIDLWHLGVDQVQKEIQYELTSWQFE
jgi:hypothetical protein